MILLTIGSDKSIFRESAARERIRAYGNLVSAMHIIVFTKRGGGEKEVTDRNIHLYPTNSRAKLCYLWDAFFSGRAIIRRMSTNERQELLISCQDPFESGLVGYVLAKFCGADLQLQLHTDFLSPYFARTSLLNRARVGLGKRLLPRAGCIRVVSQRLKRSLETHLGIEASKITVLPIWGAPLDMAQEGRKGEMPQILIVARLEKEKGVDHALLAFGEFIKRGGVGKLDIVGDGSQQEVLENLARTLGIKDQVLFHGWQNDLSRYYAKADVFFMASRYEGWGMAAADAIYAGVPVVMTDVGLAGELVRDGENGVVAPVGDIKALARGLAAVLADPKRFSPGYLPRRENFADYLSRYQASLYHCRG